MTAVNVFRGKSSVHLVTDGAGIAEDGRLAYALPKVVLLPHLRCAIALRGLANFLPVIGQMICGLASEYDEVSGAFGLTLRREWERMCEQTRRHGGAAGVMVDLSAEIYVVGWSRWRGPEAFMVATHQNLPGIAPWEIVEIGHAALTPPVPAPLEQRVLDHSAPWMLAAEVVASQRPMLWSAYAGAPERVHVGAFAQWTKVTAEGVETRIIGTWPDVLGCIPDPHAPFAEVT